MTWRATSAWPDQKDVDAFDTFQRVAKAVYQNSVDVVTSIGVLLFDPSEPRPEPLEDCASRLGPCCRAIRKSLVVIKFVFSLP